MYPLLSMVVGYVTAYRVTGYPPGGHTAEVSNAENYKINTTCPCGDKPP